jgi:hypothetical protein
MNGDRLVTQFQDPDEGLFLAEASLGKQDEFFLGQFPGFLGTGDGDRKILFWLGRKKTEFFAVVPDKEEVHETPAFYHVSPGYDKQGARQTSPPAEMRELSAAPCVSPEDSLS